MIAEVDVDHNGKMDLLEFIMMMHNQLGNTDTMQEIKMAFRYSQLTLSGSGILK